MVLADALEKKYIDNIITTKILASVYLKNGKRMCVFEGKRNANYLQAQNKHDLSRNII